MLECIDCECLWRRKWKQGNNYNYICLCQQCTERKNMPNIKITAEVDGKQVPLETISTKTFEAIKALEKPKEIPVARIGHYGNCPSDRRLFLRITNNIRQNIADDRIDVIAIDLQNGYVNNVWRGDDEISNLRLYKNIKSL